MSYHITILRTAQGQPMPISLDEVQSAVLDIEGWHYSDSPPTFEFCSAHGTCTLWHQDGELWAKTPEPWELGPMLDLAKCLGARVRCDEWESYESPDKTYFHPDDLQRRKDADAQSSALISQSMREQRLIRNAVVGLFITLGIIGYFVGKWFETS